MRRTELVSAIRDIGRALEESKIPEVLKSVSSEGDPEGMGPRAIPVMFAVMKEYAKQTINFGEIHNAIIDTFGLKELSDPDWWANHILSSEKPGTDLRVMSWRVRFILGGLPSILSLLQYDYEQTDSQQDNLPIGTSVLKIILFEEKNAFSSPQRLVVALEGLTEVYEACARIEKVSVNTISVLACDSGSDKSFDFLGIAKVFEQVRLIINDMWDKIVYFRHFEEEKKIELVTKHLKVLETTSEMANNNQLSNEEAEIIKKLTISGVSKLMEAGVATDELNQRKVYEPRQLLSPERKLLAVIASDSDKGDVEVENGNDKGEMKSWFENLSDEAVDKLKNLIGENGNKTDKNDE